MPIIKMPKNAPEVQKFVELKEIRDEVVILKDNSLKAICICSSINFDLLSITEQEAVIKVCGEVKKYLEGGGEYNLTEFDTKEESEGTWYIWKVVFSRDKLTKHFAFLKIKGKYALGDID